MADISPRSRSNTPSAITQKRALNMDEDHNHLPAISSPLNPDAFAQKAKKPPVREKKETLKKREAKGTDSTRSQTPHATGPNKKIKKAAAAPNVFSPPRYYIYAPVASDFEAPRPWPVTEAMTRAGRYFHDAPEHVHNRKTFRYTRCVGDPLFKGMRHVRASENPPYCPRFSFEDSSTYMFFDQDKLSTTTDKGFRMARMNVNAREGRWYWECKILSGVKPARGASTDTSCAPYRSVEQDAGDSGGHVRLGFARREANLDAPVGFDAYSYGLRDSAGQKVFMSRPKDFFAPDDPICEGDVIGLEIDLPSLSLHRKVVEGSYNKAVDVSDDLDPGTGAQKGEPVNFIRDRCPIRYKQHLYFEASIGEPTKDLEDFMNPAPVINSATGGQASIAASNPPNPNHPVPALRTLPFSSIMVYKNGELMGEPFHHLLAFLPPASKLLRDMEKINDILDDPTLGYYPAVSVFRGGAAECNMGPDFWFPPEELQHANVNGGQMNGSVDGDVKMKDASTKSSKQPLRPFCERYDEMIAEDVVCDIVDEVDFWVQDGMTEDLDGVGAGLQVPLVGTEPRDVVMGNGDSFGRGGIKEVVQDLDM